MASKNMYMGKQTNTHTYKQQNGKHKHVHEQTNKYTDI